MNPWNDFEYTEGRRFDVLNVNRKQLLAATVALLLVPTLSWGAGFAIFEHGARSMGMAGAMTAVADDPSAMYWNPAGLAFQQDKGMQLMVGATLIFPSQDLVGSSLGSYPGAGYKASQESQVFYPPHFFFIMPINSKLTLGVGTFTPYGLGTWWKENFAGRFISKRVDLKTFDTAINLAWRANDWLGLSAGVDYAVSQIDLTTGIGFINPYTQQLADVGQAHMFTDGLDSDAFGWNISAFADLGKGFTAGVTYRSTLDVDYEGYGSFTQYPTGYADFDMALAAAIPFGEKVALKTKIKHPDVLSIGLAWSNEQWTISANYMWQGWATFSSLPMSFPDYPELNQTVEEGYKNVSNYRLGVEYRINEMYAVQFGGLYDDTPQPEFSMSPLLGDSDRRGVTAGFSVNYKQMRFDLSYMHLFMDRRGTDGISVDGFDADYNTSADLVSMSFTYLF